MTALDLDRRISRALEAGRGIKLSDEDLDIIAACGGVDAIRAKAAEELRERAKCRDVQRRRASISEVGSGSIGTDGPMEASAPPTSPSSGMTPEEAGREALQRVQEMLPKPKARSTGTTSRTVKARPSAPHAGSGA